MFLVGIKNVKKWTKSNIKIFQAVRFGVEYPLNMNLHHSPLTKSTFLFSLSIDFQNKGWFLLIYNNFELVLTLHFPPYIIFFIRNELAITLLINLLRDDYLSVNYFTIFVFACNRKVRVPKAVVNKTFSSEKAGIEFIGIKR